MANLIRTQYLQDTNKRLLAKIVIISDGTNQANTMVIDASTLRFAMNANNYLMVSNVHPKSVYRTSIKRIYGNFKSSAGVIRLQWEGTSNSEIVAFGSGQFDFNFEASGDSAVLINPEASPTGDILITTTGLAANDAATVFIDLRKDNNDYDAGKFQDPAAFNNLR